MWKNYIGIFSENRKNIILKFLFSNNIFQKQKNSSGELFCKKLEYLELNFQRSYSREISERIKTELNIIEKTNPGI